MTGKSHGFLIVQLALRDAMLFGLSFVVAYHLRFGESDWITEYAPSVGVGAVATSAIAYILGLYSLNSRLHSRPIEHVILVLMALLSGLLAATLIGYVNFSSRIGRGFMAYGVLVSLPVLLGHHLWIFNRHRFRRQRLLVVLGNPRERELVEHFLAMKPRGIQVAEILELCAGDAPRVGTVIEATRRCRADRVVFTEAAAQMVNCIQDFRQLRYSGVAVEPLIQLCEEVLQYVPLQLLSPDWFLRADARSRLIYFSKLKRTFDVVTAAILMILLGPVLLLAALMLLTISGEGPIFFRQRRVGRFGRVFEIWKLRTMRLDAERDGPQWSSGERDPRLLRGAAFLRRYRIDEIPQLLNVLRGEMSFVGPRPEQPAIVGELAQALPFYEERHMVHPGLTGWAQVRYPYGASIDDARCKLEYDLYYLKHASVLFDALILLDTVAVVLRGGLDLKRAQPRFGFPTATAASEEQRAPLGP